MTSHDVVARVRRLAGQRRVGHGGTLDPPATGVLVLALGRATRLLPFLPTEPKRYRARIAFGAETDTLDAAGTVIATADAAGVDEGRLRAAMAGFLGPQEQIPPMVSAIKVAGERLYAKARSGGTYVRSLAADLGRALGTLAHLDRLRRTAVGRFTEADAHPLEDLAGPGRLEAAVLDPAAAMASTATRALTPAEAAALATGRTLAPTGRGDPVAAVGPDGRLVAVIQDSAGRARPKVVLA